MRTFFWAPLFSLLLAGCPSTDDSNTSNVVIRSVNECSADRRCPEGSTCVRARCYSNVVAYDSIITEIIPGPATFLADSGPFFVPSPLLPVGQQQLDVVVPGPRQVTFRPMLDGESLKHSVVEDGQPHCSWADQLPKQTTTSVPMHATLFSADRAPGLPVSTFAVNPTAIIDKGDVPIAWRLSTQVPQGTYDIYLQPTHDSGCEMPPFLMRAQRIEANPTYNISVAGSVENSFFGKIRSATRLFEGWRVDIIEPNTRLRISTHGVVGRATFVSSLQGDYYESSFGAPVGDALYPLEYLRPSDEFVAALTEPTLRLYPPPGVTSAPSFEWSIPLVLDIQGSHQTTIDLRSVELKTIDLTARLGEQDATAVVQGGLWVRSKSRSLSGIDPGLPAYFTGHTQTDSGNALHLLLPPGDYEGVAVPAPYTNLDRKRFEWTIADNPSVQTGRLISLAETRSFKLKATSAIDGSPLREVSVQVSPTITGSTDLLDDLLVPSVQALTDNRGTAELTVQTGQYDVAVQPEQDSGFAWWVLPKTQLPEVDYLAVSLPPPVFVDGQILADVGGTSIALADGLIRVYARKDKSSPYSLVATSRFGQSRRQADEPDGYFQLLLPSSIGP